MNDDEIILRLTKELYDLKAKLGIIRRKNDVLYSVLAGNSEFSLSEAKTMLQASIEIANELDTGVDYD